MASFNLPYVLSCSSRALSTFSILSINSRRWRGRPTRLARLSLPAMITPEPRKTSPLSVTIRPDCGMDSSKRFAA
ncbi:MAG: hypothetical protein ACD_34C00194G0002, partial [uncultured bacterium]